jgi:hypothetical protein
MNNSATNRGDPKLLLEAARVFNAAGQDYKRIAEVVAQLALAARDKTADAPVRNAIIGDAAALRLSGRVDGGYQSALELLKDIRDDSDGRLHLLRALANGQKYRDVKTGRLQDGTVVVDLSKQIREDLAFAFDRNEAMLAANRHFWQPDPADLAMADREDDLAVVYSDDEDFRTLVDPLRWLASADTENAKKIIDWLFAQGKVIQANHSSLQAWLNAQPEPFLKGRNYPVAAFVSGDTPAGDLEKVRERAAQALSNLAGAAGTGQPSGKFTISKVPLAKLQQVKDLFNAISPPPRVTETSQDNQQHRVAAQF